MNEEVPFPNISEQQEEYEANDDSDKKDLRERLIRLAEEKKIRHSVAYIKKCGQKALEKIMYDHERRQLDETNDLITQNLLTKFGQLMEQLDLVDEEQQLSKKLDNDIVKRDLKM